MYVSDAMVYTLVDEELNFANGYISTSVGSRAEVSWNIRYLFSMPQHDGHQRVERRTHGYPNLQTRKGVLLSTQRLVDARGSVLSRVAPVHRIQSI